MPLRNDLLNPIPGDNPSGRNLRYDPVFDKVKEARREEDDAAQGDWKYERKVADWPLVIKIAGETLATKTKDLQLAAWLTEAALKREGVAGLRESLDLLKGLLENFWDTLYPEIEDGDLEMRAAPLEWVGNRLDKAVREARLTRTGFSWFEYKASRKVPTEEEAGRDSSKADARTAAMAEGKPAPEAFDKAMDASPKAFYVQLDADFEGALESLRALDDLCTGKFGDYAPGMSGLKQTLEDVQQAVHVLLVKKREKEPDEPVAGEEPEPAAEEAVPETAAAEVEAAATPAKAKKAGGAMAAEPVDRGDAIARVASAAKFMRAESPYDPAPYMMLRGLRWGELRAAGGTIDPALLAAAPTEIRQNLKRLAMDSKWTEVLEQAEAAMAAESGRGWLDLQRYVCRACYELGSYYEPIRAAVISGLRAFLTDYPGLPEMTMMDDTATANAETLAWIEEQVRIAPPAPAAEAPPEPPPEPQPVWEPQAAAEPGAPAPPDTFELAMEAARQGRPQEGIELLMREMAQERTGRARFHRRAQLAQLCVSAGYEAIALPILQELAAEIERRKLEDWEASDLLAHPLVLLYRSLAGAGSEEQRQKLYTWLCRLDPLQALSVSR
jgi:type VI secretion system protein ImpA